MHINRKSTSRRYWDTLLYDMGLGTNPHYKKLKTHKFGRKQAKNTGRHPAPKSAPRHSGLAIGGACNRTGTPKGGELTTPPLSPPCTLGRNAQGAT